MIPLAIPAPKRVRKAIKRFRKKAEGGCARGELLRALILEGDPSVTVLRPDEETRARHAFIRAGQAYCVARCGGCALTEGYRPDA